MGAKQYIPVYNHPASGCGITPSYYVPSSGATNTGFFSCTVVSGVSIPLNALIFWASLQTAFGGYSAVPNDGFNTYTAIGSSGIFYAQNTHAGVLTIVNSGGQEIQSCSVVAYTTPLTTTLDGSAQITSLTALNSQVAGPLTTTHTPDTLFVMLNGFTSGSPDYGVSPCFTTDYTNGNLGNLFISSWSPPSTGTYSATASVTPTYALPNSGSMIFAAFQR